MLTQHRHNCEAEYFLAGVLQKPVSEFRHAGLWAPSPPSPGHCGTPEDPTVELTSQASRKPWAGKSPLRQPHRGLTACIAGRHRVWAPSVSPTGDCSRLGLPKIGGAAGNRTPVQRTSTNTDRPFPDSAIHCSLGSRRSLQVLGGQVLRTPMGPDATTCGPIENSLWVCWARGTLTTQCLTPPGREAADRSRRG